MRALISLCILAAAFWMVLFSPWTQGWFNFWGLMAVFTGILASAALVLDRGQLLSFRAFRPSYLLVGLISAALLYLVFLAGNAISARILDFAGAQIADIYLTKSQASPLVIAPLLLVWIGPAEEIFWRGFVQRRLGERVGTMRGFLLATCTYSAVHLWAFNAMLFLAALVAGAFWGAMYIKYGSVWPGIISHALWDVAVFIIWPIS